MTPRFLCDCSVSDSFTDERGMLSWVVDVLQTRVRSSACHLLGQIIFPALSLDWLGKWSKIC